MTTPLEQYIHNIPKDSQGFMLNEQERQKALDAFKQGNHSVKLSKKHDNIQYSVIQDDHKNVYAIYTTGGKSRGKNGFTHGVQGLIKVAQNLETGEFSLIKISKTKCLQEKPYYETEARAEASYLLKNKIAYGQQTRQTEKYDYKHYTFMKILPGIMMGKMGPDSKGTFRELAIQLESEKQAQFLLNILEQLQHMYQQRIIHRDLHLENVLVDPNTLEVNIIDFGLIVEADEKGFCMAHTVSDTMKTSPKMQHANGMDIENLLQHDSAFFSDKNLLTITKNLLNAAGSYQGYKSVDLAPYIEQVKEYLKTLGQKDILDKRPGL